MRDVLTTHREFNMAVLTTSGVVRDILTRDPNMGTDEVIRRAKAKGLSVTEAKIRHSVHNLRNTVRAQVVGTAKVAPAAARATTPAKTAPAAPATVSAAGGETPATGDPTGVLANVALVNTIVGLCGSIENVRQAAVAVQSCGGVEPFLRHLELVATIRGTETKG